MPQQVTYERATVARRHDQSATVEWRMSVEQALPEYLNQRHLEVVILQALLL